MKTKNPFDTKIEANKRMAYGMRDASILMTDTLDLCWAAALAVFEEQARPDHAIALLPLFIARADVEHQRTLDEHAARRGDESPQRLGPSLGPDIVR